MTRPSGPPPTERPLTARPPTGRPTARAPRRVRRTLPADTVVRGTAVALAVFVLLASGSMVESARGMPVGWQRDVMVAVTGSIDRVANLLSLNRPYDWAAERLGREAQDDDFEFPAAPDEPITPEGAPGGTPDPTTTTTTLVPVRVPDPGAPARVLVAGDSTAKSLGDTLIASTADVAELQVTNEGRVSTGLARSDYFNWGAGLSDLLEQQEPEVVVFMVGANDGQPILEADGTVVASFDTPEWEVEYRRRIAGIMDLARGDGRRLVWVGEPNVGTGNVQQAVEIGNQLAAEEAAGRPWVRFVDVAAMLAGPDGGFAEFLTLPDGTTARCYAGDGVHLTVRCLERVMEDLVPTITGLWASAP
jgi:uncharacterized protein